MALKIVRRDFSLSCRKNWSLSKTNLIFYDVAKKMEKFKGLATGICAFTSSLRHKLLVGETTIFLWHKHKGKLTLFIPHTLSYLSNSSLSAFLMVFQEIKRCFVSQFF